MDDFAITDKYLKTTLYHINISGERGIDDTLLIDGPEEYYSLSLDPAAQTESTIMQTTSTKSTVNNSSKTTNNNHTSTKESEHTTNLVNTDGAVFKSSRRNLLDSDTHDAHPAPKPYQFKGSLDSYDSSSDNSECSVSRSSPSSEVDIDSIQMFRTDTEEKFFLEKTRTSSSSTRASEKQSRSFNLQYLQNLEAQNNHSSKTPNDPIRPNLTVQTVFTSSQSPEMQARKSTSNNVTEPVITTYITIQGRRNASEEWKLIMKIPVKNGKPMVHTGEGGSNRSPKIVVPNPRDIAIQTPTKGRYFVYVYVHV